ncbi:hypothetical protein [Streptomyces sp. NPDC014685]|uniref:hypothetical protein n=1 Tax=Streptomyces sp. NPDC014685 TaxID=3364881 RepID=UPI0037034554
MRTGRSGEAGPVGGGAVVDRGDAPEDGRCGPGDVLPCPGAGTAASGCGTSRRQVAVTTGRAGPPPVAATGAGKPSAVPVLISSALLGSRARDRWTTGACPPAGPYGAAGARSGAIRRTRTGAVGAGGAEEAAGEEGPVEGVLAVGRGAAARWTVAGPGVAGVVGAEEPDAGDESTGIAEGPSGRAGFRTGPDGSDEGEDGASRPGVAPCPEPMAPGRGRRRSPSRGAPSWRLAVGGSEGSGAPIPPRVGLARSAGGGADAPPGPEGFDGPCPVGS